MPGVYAKKICPTCKKEHRKRGLFCGQSCANVVAKTGTKHSEKTKEKITRKVNEYFQSPEGIATSHMVSRQNEKRAEINEKIRNGDYILTPEDYWIDIPNLDNDDDGYSL